MSKSSSYLKHILFLLLLLSAAEASAQPTVVNGYSCTYSSDSADWIQLTRPANVPLTSSAVTSIGFDFPLEGRSYSMLLFNNSYIGFVDESSYGRYNQPMISTENPMLCVGVGFNSYYMRPPGGLRTQVMGYEGDRTMVMEFWIPGNADTDTLCKYQVQLGEYDGSVRVIFAPPSQAVSGMASLFLGSNRYVSINLTTHHFFNAPASAATMDSAWRSYTVVPVSPVCPAIQQLHVEEVTHSSARLKWKTNVLHTLYILEYGPEGFISGEGTLIVTTGGEMLLPDLEAGVMYEVRMTANCCTGADDQRDTCRFKTYCLQPHGNQLFFANLHDSTVVCKIGSFGNPDQMQLVVDFGPDTILSRHTVHYDLMETDPRTGGQLLTIPEGHCMSVRLGNHNWGAQQESVTYSVHVDTNDYDLLILRYAVVEQNPDHPLNMQPKFLFSINDSAGNPISNCYTANFVSGSATGWNSYRPPDSFSSLNEILWRDWEAVGVDLAPLHGRNIQVKLSNYDCDAGGHYGYAYFTLESARKAFETEYCGDAQSNVFYAPAGFNYRWYSLDAPGVTLSTTNSLQVTGTGGYGCWVSYNLSGSTCGFAMSTSAGPRYPAAIFQTSTLDNCGSTVQFVNHSCVSSDQAHGGLTNEPCTQYLWRFGDGTTSEAVNPVHTFPNGTFTVELVAMLSNGACRDSVQQTIHVNMPSDTERVTICPESQYFFYDRLLSDSGRYYYYSDCQEHILDISVYSVSEVERCDTICEGDVLAMRDTSFAEAGRHRYAEPDRHQCDSVQWINLVVKPRSYFQIDDTLLLGEGFEVGDTFYPAPAVYEVSLAAANGCDSIVTLRLSCIDQRDSLVCHTALPLTWDGVIFSKAGADTSAHLSMAHTDSLVVRTLAVRYPPQVEPLVSRQCTPPAYYTVQLPAGYRYTWDSDPVDSALLRQHPDTVAHIFPARAADYLIAADYLDAPSCPDTITLPLEVMRYLVADLYVSEPWLSADKLDFEAVDQSSHATGRQWFVDGVRQWTDEPHLHYTADAKADSVVLMLRVDNGTCEDSVTRVLPIYHYTLAFPNVFTPGAETNNRFGCTATHIGDYGLWIYDRRGALVFSSHDQRQVWDGTAHGVPCQQGAYTYHCQYSIPVAGMQTKVGTVLLLR